MEEKTIVAILGSGGVVSLLVKYLVNKKSKRKRKQKVLTVTNHIIFYYLDEIERQIKNEFTVPNNIISHNLKQEAFKDIMINKIKIWRREFKELVKEYKCVGDCSKCKMTISQSRTIHMKALDRGIDKYSNYFKNSNYSQEDQDILEICMEDFNNLYSSNASFVTDSIKTNHVVPEFVRSFCPINATGLILDMYRLAMSKMLPDITSSIKDMNGRLKGRSFGRRSYSFTE